MDTAETKNRERKEEKLLYAREMFWCEAEKQELIERLLDKIYDLEDKIENITNINGMGKVQDYLEKKRIEKLGLPKIWIVRSDRNGVDLLLEDQVVVIVKNISAIYDGKKKTMMDRYKIKNSFPYDIDIEVGHTSAMESGYGTGEGDLWAWSYFSSLSKLEAEEYYDKELVRVNEKYLSK
jgi:hypothetical protein